MYVHYAEVFCTEMIQKSVQCSELGGVHYVEVQLQQKSIGGTKKPVQTGGVHYAEVFINGGFTVYISKILWAIFFQVKNLKNYSENP